MASDSCVTSDGTFITNARKVFRTSAGALMGQAGDGDCRAVFAMLDKVKTFKQLPTKQEIAAHQTDFELIMALSAKDVWIIGCSEMNNGRFDGFAYQVNNDFCATGSGWKFAMAAMACGRSARDAVLIACDFDRSSKLPVHSLSFDLKPKSKPKPK